MLYAIFNGILIAYRSTRLYKSGDTCFMTELNTIVKREKSIRSQYGAIQIEFEMTCFFHSLTQSIYPAGLSAPLAQQLFMLHQGNGVRRV